MPDDAELLRAFAKQRSDAAFAELVRRHIDLVYATAARRLGGDAHRANDVTQQVFIRLARKAAALVDHPSLAGWLHTCTRYLVADVIRAEQRRRARERSSGLDATLSMSPDVPIDWERLRPMIDDALDQLKGDEREAVLLRFFCGLPWAEVGARLRVSDDAARKRVEYSLERLRVQLARRGITSSAAALAQGLAAAPLTTAPTGLAGAITSGALAAAHTAPASALPLFMSMAKSTGEMGVWALAAVSMIGTASLATLAWREEQNREGLRTELALVRRTHDRVLSGLRTRIADAQRERHVLQRRAAEPVAPTARPLSPMEMQAAIDEALNANPEYTALTHRAYRLDVQEEFGAFLATLPAEQAAALREMLVRRREQSMQRSLELRKNGPPPGAKLSMFGDMGGYAVTIAPTPDAPEMMLVLQMNQLLGETGYARFQEYDRLRMYALPVRRIAADLGEQGAALSGAQQTQLQQLLRETQTYPGSGRGEPNIDSTPTAEETSLHHRALAFLSPLQARLLTAYLIDQRVAMSYRQRLTASVFSTPAGSTAPSR